MNRYERRVVVPLPIATVVGETSRAIREEGLQTIARIDVRDHFWHAGYGLEPCRYFLLEAWSPELALEVLRHDREAGTILPTRFAIYELASGETAVVASEPLAAIAAEPHWQENAPRLRAVAGREAHRVARVLGSLQRSASEPASAVPAA